MPLTNMFRYRKVETGLNKNFRMVWKILYNYNEHKGTLKKLPCSPYSRKNYLLMYIMYLMFLKSKDYPLFIYSIELCMAFLLKNIDVIIVWKVKGFQQNMLTIQNKSPWWFFHTLILRILQRFYTLMHFTV